MTITDFSALTMRLPALDTATLSQAWRDALQQVTLPKARPSRMPVAARMPVRGTSARLHSAKPAGYTACVSSTSVALRAASRQAAQGMEPIEPRPRSRQVSVQTNAVSRRQAIREKHVISLPDGQRICLLISPLPHSTRITVLCAPHLQQAMRAALSDTARLLVKHFVALDIAPFAQAS